MDPEQMNPHVSDARTILKNADSERRAEGQGTDGIGEEAFLCTVARWAFLPLGPK